MNRPGFFDGMGYPFRGVKHLLAHRELWPWAIKSLVVGLLLFVVLVGIAAAIVLGWFFADGLTWKTGLLGCAAALLGIVGGVVLFALIGNVIAGPYLEAMTERMMAARLREGASAGRGRIRETSRGYWSAFRAGLFDQAGRFGLFLAVQAALLVTYVTPLGLIHPLLASAVTIFFVALEHLEYPLEARGLRFFARIDWGLRRLGPSLGFGATLFFVMPVAGFVFLPAAVCGAVLLEADLSTSAAPGA